MKKITLNSIVALFTASAWATSLTPGANGNANPYNITTDTNRDAIMFWADEGIINVGALLNVQYSADSTSENRGNIKVGKDGTEFVEGTINATDPDENDNVWNAIILQQGNSTSKTTGKIFGFGTNLSVLNFNGDYIKNDYGDVYIEDVALNMTKIGLSGVKNPRNTISGVGIKVENSILNVNTPSDTSDSTKNASILNAKSSSTFNNALTTARSFYFKNTEVNIYENATLQLQTGTAGVLIEDSNVSLETNATLNIGSNKLIFKNSTITFKGAFTNVKSWQFEGVNTINVHSDLDLTQSSDTNNFWGRSITFNLKNASVENTSDNGTQLATTLNLVGESGTTNANFKYINLNKNASVLNVSTTTATFTKLDMASGATLNVSAGETTVGDIFATTKINLDVASGAVLTITDFNQATEGETFKIALNDEIVKGALLVADEKIGVYASEVASREYMFVDEVGNERVVGSNLWIEAVGNDFWSVYTSNPAVPEPAEWAAIFGAIALGFTVYRRRK